MFDDFQAAPLTDLDDFDLPEPETEEDMSEDPTAFASTADILAAVAARVAATQSIGEVELDDAPATGDRSEPTLAHQPVNIVRSRAADIVARSDVDASGAAGQVEVAAIERPPAQPRAAEDGSFGALLLAIFMVSAALFTFAWLAMDGGF